MNMSFVQSIIMGIVSGFTQMLPISAEAHRALLRCLMGIESEDPVFRLLVHISCLIALMWCSREERNKMSRTRRLMRIPPRRRKFQPDTTLVYTVRIYNTALVLLILGRIFTLQFSFVANELQILAFSLIGNGILLLIPSLVPNGNKDPRNMLRLDGILMGLGAGLSVIPGFSLVGATTAIGICRAVDRKFSLKFAYLLLVPGLVIHIIFDLIAVIAGGAAVFSVLGLAAALAGAVASFFGCVMGYRLMNYLVLNSNFSAFSYYCFGAGLFTFVLFLNI